MTTTRSMFACAASDVTLDRVRELVREGQPESLTLEYKEGFTSNLVKSICAMANSYGGLIVVGVTDHNQPDRVVGVPEATIVKVVNACHEQLEPPWQPEIIPVPVPDPDEDKYVLVVRVDHRRAPRPLLLGGAAQIRLQGRNATADRGRLAQLFRESDQALGTSRAGLPRLELQQRHDSPTPDFVARSGLLVPTDDSASWRPLSERGIEALAVALNQSQLNGVLVNMVGAFGEGGLNPFHPAGFNRARHARLLWQGFALNGGQPIEAAAQVKLPDAYGVPSTILQFILDIEVRATSYLKKFDDAPVWHLDVPYLYSLLDGLLASLVSESVVTAIANLAGVDPVVVPQPPSCDFITQVAAQEVLDRSGLVTLDRAGASRGANLVADPTLDLRDDDGRREQVDSWIQQIALDAGLRGMQALLEEYHQNAH